MPDKNTIYLDKWLSDKQKMFYVACPMQYWDILKLKKKKKIIADLRFKFNWAMTKSDVPSLSSPPPNLYPLEWREKRNSGDLEPLGSHYCQNQKITETIFNFHYIGIFITYPGACEPPSHYYEHVTFRLSTEVSYPNPVLASECVQIKTVKPD